MRGLVGFIICIVSCAVNGCVPGSGIATIHPHSEVMEPTFCIHYANEPAPIKRLKVSFGRETVWELKYAPEVSGIPSRPLSCITYGKPPPGYKETAPAPPLTPDISYYAWLWDNGHAAEVYFIIRSDASGRAIKLEYKYPYGYDRRVHVITKP